MALFRRSRGLRDQTLAELEREQRSLERRYRETERRLREEPERHARERAEQAVTLPPPDDLADRQREHRFYATLSRGQLRNERRSQAGSVFLFVLLISATVALVMWMMRIAGM